MLPEKKKCGTILAFLAFAPSKLLERNSFSCDVSVIFDVCERIKERRPDTAVIFLTANDMESDMLKGFELGVDDYVTKPFPVSVFRKVDWRVEKVKVLSVN